MRTGSISRDIVHFPSELCRRRSGMLAEVARLAPPDKKKRQLENTTKLPAQFLPKCFRSGVNRGQRGHKGSFRGYPKQGLWCGVLSTCLSTSGHLPPELPSFNTGLYRLPMYDNDSNDDIDNSNSNSDSNSNSNRNSDSNSNSNSNSNGNGNGNGTIRAPEVSRASPKSPSAVPSWTAG